MIDGAVELSVTVADGVGITAYQWFENDTIVITGGTEIPGATSATYTPDTSVAGKILLCRD